MPTHVSIVAYVWLVLGAALFLAALRWSRGGITGLKPWVEIWRQRNTQLERRNRRKQS